MPFSARDNVLYGGNTSCVRVDYGGETLLLDAGTGLLQYMAEKSNEIESGKPIRCEIILSHLHLDHIIGLPTFSPIFSAGNDIIIYTKNRSNAPLAQQVLGLFSPPYWPVNLAAMPHVTFVEITNEPFTTRGGLTVYPFQSTHQDDTTVFRLEGDKSLVYLLDCEVDNTLLAREDFLHLCQNADSIIFDSSYLPQDYTNKKGWGHSTYKHGIQLAELSNCKHMVFSHYNSSYPDSALDAVADILAQESRKYAIAYDGMVYTL